MLRWCQLGLPTVMLTGLIAGSAHAAPAIKDDGKLFSDSAKQQADAIIAEIHRDFKRTVHIEAYKEPPADRKDEWSKNKTNGEFRRRFFRLWAEERGRATKSDVFILCYAESLRGWFVQVESSNATKARDFKEEDEDEVRRVFGEYFKDGKYNEGLVK